MNARPHFVCVHEYGEGSGKVGLFRVVRDDKPENDRWIIARIPASWHNVRSSRLIPPDADGNIELPRNLFPEVKSKAEAIRYFPQP
jgi:hypothetical protein